MKKFLISIVAAVVSLVCVVPVVRAAEFQALDSLGKAHYGATHVAEFTYRDLAARGTNTTLVITNSIGRVGQGIAGVALLITQQFLTTNTMNTNLTFIAGMGTNTALYFATAAIHGTTNARIVYASSTPQVALVAVTNTMTLTTTGPAGLEQYTSGAARVYFKILDPLNP